MTANHRFSRDAFSRQGGSRRVDRRPDGALLAGVCIRIANRLGWNVWALRVLFILGLLIETIAVGLIYGALALLLPRLGPGAGDDGPGRASGQAEDAGLTSDALGARNRRIADLERRFRELEETE